jgi:hypothetical protein
MKTAFTIVWEECHLVLEKDEFYEWLKEHSFELIHYEKDFLLKFAQYAKENTDKTDIEIYNNFLKSQALK